MLGVEKKIMNNLVVGDADALIALIYEDDPNHHKAIIVSQELVKFGKSVVFPNTAILEAIVALKRGLNLPDRANTLNSQYLKGSFTVEYVNQEIQQRASEIFKSARSKKNTIFDAVVIATAEKLGTKSIFSFDNWYPKKGFKLV